MKSCLALWPLDLPHEAIAWQKGCAPRVANILNAGLTRLTPPPCDRRVQPIDRKRHAQDWLPCVQTPLERLASPGLPADAAREDLEGPPTYVFFARGLRRNHGPVLKIRRGARPRDATATPTSGNRRAIAGIDHWPGNRSLYSQYTANSHWAHTERVLMAATSAAVTSDFPHGGHSDATRPHGPVSRSLRVADCERRR